MAKPSKQPTAPEPEAQESLEKLKRWGQWVLMGVAVVFLAFSAFQWNRSRIDGEKQEIYLSYSSAFTPEALAQVVEAFPDAPEAALARIQMGGMFFRDGEFESALAAYDSFLRAHPRHAFIHEVRFARAMALEALDQLEEALEGFQSVDPSMLMYAQAQFGVARIHERQGRPDLAVAIYAAIEESFPDSAWSFQAEIFRQAAELDARRLARSTSEDE